MDGFINSKIEKQTIYEIYRACRLCGAGAGYKMPIIQNVVSLDGAEVELKQKIRECVQIEVHQDDKMPPLICELCVDKVNDFYEFLEMCRHTNKRTRLRLGLPPQAMPRGAPDAGDCILGVTEPVFLNDDSNEHSLRSKKSNNSGKTKKEDKKNIISNNSKKDIRDIKKEPRSLRSKQPSPPRLRGTKRYQEEEISLSKLQKSTRSSDPAPKSILKKQKEIQIEDDLLLAPRLKRPRDREVIVKKEMQNKRVKIQVQPLPPRTTRTSPNIKAKSLPSHKCKICKAEFDNPKSLNNHMRSHTFTKPSVKPTKKENKEIKCTDCRQIFSRKTLLNVHKCPKQGGDCSVCKRHFYSQKSLIRHRSTCVEKKKELVISPRIRRMLRPLQVRVARCDPLFENVSGEHYDVSDVVHDYGLDKTCVYPYLYSGSSHVKFEPGCMVNINDDIKQAFDADKYVHWDSEDTDSDADLLDSVKKVDSLTAISLKTLFSKRCLGKVPKKRRKVKAEKAFDSILNVSEFDSELKQGINDIIDSLDKIDEPVNESKGDNDSLFGDENPPTVTNDDFDSLFKNDETNDVSSANDNDKVVTEGDVDKNVVNESSVSEDSSKENRLELSKELSIDSNEQVEVENAEKSLSNEEVVNKIESKNEEITEMKTIDSELYKKLNDGNVSGGKLDNKENTQIIDSNTKNLDITSEGTEIDSESSKPECLIDDKVDKNQESDLSKLECTELPINTDETNSITDKNASIDEENCYKTTDTKIEKVNGASEERFSIEDLEDLSDSEMDDNRLMEALDAQIGESETDKSEKEKTLDDKRNDYEPCSVKCADLESISDGEFNLNE